jgi:4-diphosphocytidyl-2-C-methyl-D-erythritol kinase
MRKARVKAFAKVNLSLEILGRRPDGFHDLRTVFQTISLHDTIDIEFTPGRKTGVDLDSTVEIANNLVVRAAQAVLDETNAKGRAGFVLRKRIPMGGGLGGGSADAAAVLLALPVLTGRPVDWVRLVEIGAALGSDVPFFLLGGTALGFGRGTELYPLKDAKRTRGVVVAPGIHVSTPEAFKALARPLTWEYSSPKINTSQRVALCLDDATRVALGEWAEFCSNDFEAVVFRQHPRLGVIKRKLKQFGAKPALMSGSGSSVYGVFESAGASRKAQAAFPGEQVFPISFVSRARYYAAWWQQLSEHIQGREWPPHSRYAR